MLRSEKPQELERLTQLLGRYPVIGMLDMHKLPARQLQSIRSGLGGAAQITMSRKSLIVRALTAANVPLPMQARVPALILSSENPFRLFALLKKSRSPAKARAGDVAANDIVVPKGPTPLPPGPAISTLQKVGLKTSVQGGKIQILQDKPVATAGTVITEDMVGVFNLLKIEPMEVGLDLVAAVESGVFYDRTVLDVDVEGYLKDVTKALQEALGVSIEIGFPTGDNAELMVAKAFSEAKSIAIECGIITSEFVEDAMIRAMREAEEIKKVTEGI